MREKLNNDPRTQMIVIAVVAVVFAIVMFTMVLGGEEAPAPTVDPATGMPVGVEPPAAGGVAPADGGIPTDPAAPVVPTDPAAPVVPSGTVPAVPDTSTVPEDPGAADGLLPGKGLPEDVLVAYARGKALALIVVDPKGLADQKLEAYTRELGERDDVETFVVDVDDIVKYSRITQGVSVSRAPALIVVTPRQKAGDVPTASVSYGFRSPRSVEIALEDILYDGKPVSSFPE